jgi:hypothetical protein
VSPKEKVSFASWEISFLEMVECGHEPPRGQYFAGRNGPCDETGLSDADRVEIARAAEDRNLQDCLNGSGSCDRKLLGVEEQRDVANAGQDHALPD